MVYIDDNDVENNTSIVVPSAPTVQTDKSVVNTNACGGAKINTCIHNMLVLVRIYQYIKYRYISARGNKLSLGVIHPM